MTVQPLIERSEQLGIKLYRATWEEDYLIARWWDAITESGEIHRLISTNAHQLSNFYTLFKPPNMLSYTTKEDALESTHWVEPIATSSHTIFLSSWWEPSSRGTKRHAQVMSTVYEVLFAMGKRTILGITKQGRLLGLHRGIGYDIMGPVPNLFDDEKGWIMSLTENNFRAGRLYRAASRSYEGKLDAAA